MNSETPIKSAFGRKEWLFLLFICASSFIQQGITVLQGLLYPPEAENKAVSASVYGIVMGFYRVTILVLCPFFAVYVRKIGVRRCFLLCMFSDGLCPVLFGWLHFIEPYTYFLTLSLILRGLEGVAVAGMKCSVYAMVGDAFGGRIALVVGLVEVMYVSAMTVGPVLAAYIFGVLGFRGPFFVFGSVQIICTITAIIWLPEMLHQPERTQLTVKETFGALVGFLKVPSIGLFILGTAIATGCSDFIQTILEPFLEQFDLTTEEKGFTFLLIGPFQFLSPAWGFLLDRTSRGELVTLFAALIQTGAFLVIGPISFVPLSPSLGLTDAGLLLFGFAQGALTVSCFSKLAHRAKENGLSETRTGNTLISTSFVAAQALGAGIGAPIAGLLYNNFGFRRATIFPVASSLVLCSLLLLFVCFKKPSHLQTEAISYRAISEAAQLLPKLRS